MQTLSSPTDWPRNRFGGTWGGWGQPGPAGAGRVCGSVGRVEPEAWRAPTPGRGLVTYRTRHLLGFLFLNRALIL